MRVGTICTASLAATDMRVGIICAASFVFPALVEVREPEEQYLLGGVPYLKAQQMDSIAWERTGRAKGGKMTKVRLQPLL
jgi:hypothetical protein